jgi:hypothetical protein
MRFEVYCDNASSFGVGRQDKSAILVKCNRRDPTDNARGLSLASKIADMLNELPPEEADTLVGRAR